MDPQQRADRTWQDHYFSVWSVHYKKIVHILTAIQMLFFVISRDHYDYLHLRTIHRDIGFIPEPAIVGERLALVQSVAPLVLCLGMTILLSTRVYSSRTHASRTTAQKGRSTTNKLSIVVFATFRAFLEAEAVPQGVSDPWYTFIFLHSDGSQGSRPRDRQSNHGRCNCFW